jgi:ferrous iron transport protein A
MMSLPKQTPEQSPRLRSPQAAEPPSELRTLDTAPDAARAEVVEVHGGPAVVRQLAHVGICVGAILEVRRSAPLGGPVLVEIGGSSVAVGRGVARKVRVRLQP